MLYSSWGHKESNMIDQLNNNNNQLGELFKSSLCDPVLPEIRRSRVECGVLISQQARSLLGVDAHQV